MQSDTDTYSRRDGELSKTYDSREAELRWQKQWEEWGIYRFDPKSNHPIYSIDTPPPTVSGKMHIGHAFSYSHMDFVARYKRMAGFNVFYPFGTDDNGLATDRMIERMKRVKCQEVGRKKYVQICLQTLEEIRPSFVADWKRIGISADWTLVYSTINEHCQRVSQRSFIDLYNMGRVYRKEAPTIWCPTCSTAIAQVELQDRQLESYFNNIYFELEGGSRITIATTRPELLPSCVAVFVHPDDQRFTHIVGKRAVVPLFGQLVPIIADSRAKPEKGTGIVMCCTFGDLTDIEWWQAHKLPLKISVTADGKMNELAGNYEGLTIKEAREKILDDLKEQGLVEQRTLITHTVNVHERCGTEIEFLVSKQWFIKYLDLRQKFLEAGAQMSWFPLYMKNRYDNWVKGLQWDWCISRQRCFGVSFPVWYCKQCGKVKLADVKELPVDPTEDKPKNPCECGSFNFYGEPDVMDTWATSSLTPQIAAGLCSDEKLCQKLFPMSLRPQAHDIISFWLFNTVVKSQLHYDKNPWMDIMISGWVLDPHGKKMAKSKGNVIEPQTMINRYSADCLRFWASGSTLGEDMTSQEKELITAKRLITKLWNAARFTSMVLGDYTDKTQVTLEIEDRWVLSELNRVVREATNAFDNYEYSRAKAATELYFWDVLCSNYLEMIKRRVYSKERGANVPAIQYTLYHVLLAVLKLFAPILPHVTEEIYQAIFRKNEAHQSIHISPWPQTIEIEGEEEALELGKVAVATISTIRKFKNSMALALNSTLESVEIHAGEMEAKVRKVERVITDTMAIEKVKYGSGNGKIDVEGFPITISVSADVKDL